MKTFIFDKIEEADMFGYPIILNFKAKDTNTINTIQGGFCTLFIWIIVGVESFTAFKAMFGYQNDSVSVNETVLDYDKLGLVGME
jgi:hypothetical protein